MVSPARVPQPVLLANHSDWAALGRSPNRVSPQAVPPPITAPALPSRVTTPTPFCWASNDSPLPHNPPAAIEVVIASAVPSRSIHGLGGGGGGVRTMSMGRPPRAGGRITTTGSPAEVPGAGRAARPGPVVGAPPGCAPVAGGVVPATAPCFGVAAGPAAVPSATVPGVAGLASSAPGAPGAAAPAPASRAAAAADRSARRESMAAVSAGPARLSSVASSSAGGSSPAAPSASRAAARSGSGARGSSRIARTGPRSPAWASARSDSTCTCRSRSCASADRSGPTVRGSRQRASVRALAARRSGSAGGKRFASADIRSSAEQPVPAAGPSAARTSSGWP